MSLNDDKPIIKLNSKIIGGNNNFNTSKNMLNNAHVRSNINLNNLNNTTQNPHLNPSKTKRKVKPMFLRIK